MNTIKSPYSGMSKWILWPWWFASLLWPNSSRWRDIGAELDRRSPAVIKRDGGFPEEPVIDPLGVSSKPSGHDDPEKIYAPNGNK